MLDEIRPNPGNPKDATCSICGALLVCLSCGEHRDQAIEHARARIAELEEALRHARAVLQPELANDKPFVQIGVTRAIIDIALAATAMIKSRKNAEKRGRAVSHLTDVELTDKITEVRETIEKLKSNNKSAYQVEWMIQELSTTLAVMLELQERRREDKRR